jgi:hypothetical protein
MYVYTRRGRKGVSVYCSTQIFFFSVPLFLSTLITAVRVRYIQASVCFRSFPFAERNIERGRETETETERWREEKQRAKEKNFSLDLALRFFLPVLSYSANAMLSAPSVISIGA